jgi:hypothetical protein
MNKYSPKELIQFKINGVDYCLPKYLPKVEQFELFNEITKAKNSMLMESSDDIPNLIIEDELILNSLEMLFDAVLFKTLPILQFKPVDYIPSIGLYLIPPPDKIPSNILITDAITDADKKHLITAIGLIRCMKYFLIDRKIIKQIITSTLENIIMHNTTALSFIKICNGVIYYPEMILILDVLSEVGYNVPMPGVHGRSIFFSKINYHYFMALVNEVLIGDTDISFKKKCLTYIILESSLETLYKYVKFIYDPEINNKSRYSIIEGELCNINISYVIEENAGNTIIKFEKLLENLNISLSRTFRNVLSINNLNVILNKNNTFSLNIGDKQYHLGDIIKKSSKKVTIVPALWFVGESPNNYLGVQINIGEEITEAIVDRRFVGEPPNNYLGVQINIGEEITEAIVDALLHDLE